MYPTLPYFRRRLTQYISTDFDLISLLPYLPRKINHSVCTLEGDYRVNIEKIIKIPEFIIYYPTYSHT